MRAASPPQQNESENETIVISHPLFSWEKAFRDCGVFMLYAAHHIAFPTGAEAAASFPHCQNPIRAL
ncbi:MAG: hypothetical protein MR569_00260 [Dialister sp.]|jgi:hypothetical protein|nr:hypothetical protein [Dialister sp.]